MYVDRMQIQRNDAEATPDYGTLFLIKQRKTNVNDYGGSDIADVSKLVNITAAAVGSTCLFSNGDIYRLELDGWAKFGENETAAASNSASPASLNLSPLDINRNDLMNKTSSSDIEETPEEMTVEPITIDGEMI